MRKHRNKLLQAFSLVLIAFVLVVNPGKTTAQSNPVDSLAGCGVSAIFFESLGVDTSNPNVQNLQPGLTPPANFPSNAIVTCGKFRVYFRDLMIGNGGFAEGGGLTGTIGIERRATLCAVLAYIETLIDFSNMGSNEYIRIYVDQSLSTINTAPVGTQWLARAGPFYDQTVAGVKNGWVYDYIDNGTDPTTSDNFHAILHVNFHGTYNISNPNTLVPVNYLNDYSDPISHCQYDLYSVLLHEMGHALGYFSLIEYTENTVNSTWGDANLAPVHTNINIFSGLDFSEHVGATPSTSMTKLVTGSLSAPTLNNAIPMPQANLIWLNNNAAPNNYPVFSGDDYQEPGWGGSAPAIFRSYGSHLDDQLFSYSRRERLSPGDNSFPVMGPISLEGSLRRTFTKADIQGFAHLANGSMPYQFTTTYPNIANLLNNSVPFCSKLAGTTFSTYPDNVYLPEELPADVTTLVNNTGSFVDINLSTDATISDINSGDNPAVDLSTVTNFRGCDLNGNNHGCLTFLNNNTVIRFTPKQNFFGRAQFGFNLTDGHERGGYVVYTIDVTPGTNSTAYVAGTTDMIFNGGFEQGTELRRLGTEESKINTVTDKGFYEGKLIGTVFSDWHPYSFLSNKWTFDQGIIVNNSAIDCVSGTAQLKYSFGHGSTSWPMTGMFLVPPSPTTPANIQLRCQGYMGFSYGYYPLKANMQNCHRYRLEYDVFTSQPVTSLPMIVGFGNNMNYPAGQFITAPTTIFSQTINLTVTSGVWQHVVRDFYYCGAPSAIMYIHKNVGNPEFVVDNLSVKELLNQPPPTVTIVSSNPNNCTILLTANVTNIACDVTYQWNLNGQPISGATSSTYQTSSGNGGTYSVIVTGCNGTASDDITVTASCDPCAYFGTTNPNLLSGTISSNINGGGPYYLNSGITISGNVTISNAVIFIGGTYTIDVNATAKLTLDNCHLFGCSNMWRGISLLTNSGNTGVLDIKNNTLIEDAVNAVSISSPTVPNTGTYILQSNKATFNRNRNNIVIAGAQSQSVNNHYKISNTIISGRDYSTFTGYPSDWPEVTDLKAAYTGQFYEAPYNIITYNTAPCKNGQVEETGIQLTSVGPTVSNVYYELQLGASGGTTEMNIFDNLRYGIYADRSNFASVNNTFIQMTSPNTTGGDGIFATAPATNFRARIYEPDATITTGNSFYGFYRGVEIVGYREVLGSKSLMITSNANPNIGLYGYKIISKNYTSVNVSDNQIYNLQNGIYVAADVTPLHMGAINVDRNKLGSVSNGNNPMFMKYGIIIERILGGSNGQTGPTTSGIIRADRNELSHVKYGIKLASHNQESSISYNTISLDNNNDPLQYGIKHQGSGNEWTFNNRITGPGYQNGSLKGIETIGNSRHYVNCNTVTECPYGIVFAIGSLYNTQWHGNTMTNNKQGFRLDKANISTQKSNGWACENRWLANNGFSYTNGNYQTFVQNTSPPASSFLPAQSKLNVSNSTDYNPTANNGFPNVPANIFSIGNGLATTNITGIEACPVKIKIPDHGNLVNIMMNIGDYGKYNGTANFITQYDLWQAARTRDTMISDTAGFLREFVDLGYNSRFYQLAYIDSLFGEEDTTSIRSIISTGTILNPLYDTSANGLVIADDTAANRVIENYIKLYDLYIKYMGGYMDSADTVRVDSIANLCVLYDGNGVFQARSFHNLLHEDDLKEFADVCDTPEASVGQGRYAQEGGSIMPFELKQVSGTQSYSLLPNPNNGNFIVKQLVSDDRPVNAEVWNAIGAKVYGGKLVFSGKQAVINLSGMASGGYLLKLYDNKGQHYTIKFIIIE